MNAVTVRPGESDPIPLYARAHPPAMAAMDFKIPTVLTSEELMEKAFHRAYELADEI